jgi:transposase
MLLWLIVVTQVQFAFLAGLVHGLAFDHHFDAVLTATAARDRLDEQIVTVAASPRWADPVDRLGCLRGISALTGLALSVEIGDWTRFTGSSIGAYVGLVPSEYSSGTSRAQGSITKAGNAHVRRLLIEAAWHHRAAYRNPGPTMRARWAKVDPALKARGKPAPAPAVVPVQPTQEKPRRAPPTRRLAGLSPSPHAAKPARGDQRRHHRT